MAGGRAARMRALLARTAVVGALATGGLVGVQVGSASAAGPIVCTAAGTVTYSHALVGDLVTWSVIGKGSCLGDGQGTYFLDFTGTGTSHGLGACDDGVVSDLNIRVSGTYTNAATLVPKFINQTWSSPVTTFPETTPFTISGNGTGAGTIVTHIVAHCPPSGSPVAEFAFSFLQ